MNGYKNYMTKKEYWHKENTSISSNINVSEATLDAKNQQEKESAYIQSLLMETIMHCL